MRRISQGLKFKHDQSQEGVGVLPVHSAADWDYYNVRPEVSGSQVHMGNTKEIEGVREVEKEK